VDTDRTIKVLFERLGQSLLPFVGERRPGIRLTAVETVELPVPSRRIDSVLRLERDGFVWYRHLEFQAGPDPDMPRRCFEYNSRLILHYDAAVLTTVLYLLPGSDREAQDAFRLYVGDEVAYEWRFDVVRLWEIGADLALQSGQAGPLALVPLLRGGDEPDTLLAAVRKLDALPRPESANAMSTLLDLASQRYDRATFTNVLGKDRVMQSWLWQMGRDEGEAKGRAEGRAEGEAQAARQICIDLSRECHPRVAARVLPAIEACDRPETLRAWVLQCPKISDAEFVTLVTGRPRASVTRSRTSRPSRASRRPSFGRKRR
jgi:predicted transposase YdaD